MYQWIQLCTETFNLFLNYSCIINLFRFFLNVNWILFYHIASQSYFVRFYLYFCFFFYLLDLYFLLLYVRFCYFTVYFWWFNIFPAAYYQSWLTCLSKVLWLIMYRYMRIHYFCFIWFFFSLLILFQSFV